LVRTPFLVKLGKYSRLIDRYGISSPVYSVTYNNMGIFLNNNLFSVSCTIWEDNDAKRADLSVLDISSAIIARVESMPENVDYFYGGIHIKYYS